MYCDPASMMPAGQGFGINPAIYTNRDGLFNALGGLQTLVANRPVKAATIITPHVYGAQITGLPSCTFSLAACSLTCNNSTHGPVINTSKAAL